MIKKAETKTDKTQIISAIKEYPFILFIFSVVIILNIALMVGILRFPFSILALIGFAVFVFWYVDRLGGFTLFR